jgi:hypothetical protein
LLHERRGLFRRAAGRTYRNAWRRSHNGGPILLDERKVMEIDEARMWSAYEASARR